jgi:hypothetical protein
LARNFESNGPDVKIRGTAVHIAEKYMTLARDALASGDIIAAESYFQHAEHYNRIIMAAQSQLGPQHGSHPGDGGNGGFRPRWNADGSSDDDGPDMEGGQGTGGNEDMRGGGGRDHYERRGPNGSEGQGRDSNGSDPADADQPDESASDPVG